MSKIICDVCGTSYPETATQCPICGCARPADAHGAVVDSTASETAGYTYVKGGRFSKANVRKRNLAKQNSETINVMDDNGKKNDKNKPLLIIAFVLAAAIIAVVLYIVFHFFAPFGQASDPGVTQPSASDTLPAESTEDTTQPTIEDIYCSDLSITKDEIELNTIGASYLLDVTASPADTTDKIYFESEDEAIATVSDEGLVTFVAEGQTRIIITCGSIQKAVDVVCVEQTEPTEETTEATEPTEFVELKLNREDFSLFYIGESWIVYDGELDVKEIIWTSDNESIATVADGKVVATGFGMTTIYAQYGEQKVSCIVRCERRGSSGSGGVSQEGSGNGDCAISAEDVTIRIGESFTLTLSDASGNTVSVTWSVSNSGICSVSGNTVTGVSSGTAVVETTYNGNYYSCIVRVV